MMHNGDREFSKRLVRWTFAAFWIQVFIGLAFALVRPDVTAWQIEALSTTAALTGAVHVGYFGKAGAENWRKIGTEYNEAEG